MTTPTSKNFWQQCPRPIVGLAPMDGYSDSAFRRTCKAAYSPLITYTEFTSADGIYYNPNRLRRRLYFDPSEQPVIAQIFGKSVQTFIEATKFCEDMGFTGIDLNMGCPSKKVVRSEHGVALRKNPALACKLIEAVASHTRLPVSVKTRLGWDNADDLIPFCQSAVSAGADMICIHARTYKEPYRVPAQWDHLYALKAAVSVPILGNGGVTSLEDGFKKCGNLDGFLIGQASFGNPWVFSPDPLPPLSERLALMAQHAQWLVDDKGETVGCREIRKHLVHYMKGFSGAKAFRSRLVRVDTLTMILDLLDEINATYTH